MLCTQLGHFIRYMVLYFLSMEHMCSFMHYVSCTGLACRVQERTLHTAYWSLLQETIWISTGEPTPRMNEAFFTKSKAAVKLHCTAMFHLSVDDCAPFRLIIEPPLWPETILTCIPCQADSIYAVNISACSHLIPSESEPACSVVTQITPVKVMTGAS